jgi:hypothetical protein
MTKTEVYRTVMGGITLLILGLVIWVSVLISREIKGTSVSSYADLVVEPANGIVCPGDLLVYTQTVSYQDTPVVVRLVASVWSVDQQRMVVYDTAPRYANFLEPVTFTGRVEWPIPEDFQPGLYERRVSGQAEGREPRMFVVRFTVADDCA